MRSPIHLNDSKIKTRFHSVFRGINLSKGVCRYTIFSSHELDNNKYIDNSCAFCKIHLFLVF